MRTSIRGCNLSKSSAKAVKIDHGLSLSRRAWLRLRRQRQTMICLGIIGVYLSIAVLGYLGLLPDFQERVGTSYEQPGFELSKILGTDIFGRSILYKILAGAKTAITIGFLVTALSIPVGIFAGGIAGYFGGRVDAFVVWVYSVIVSVPYILLVLAISYILGKGMLSICIAMASVSWVGLCRLIRGEFMKHKNQEYVLASRLLGAGDLSLIFRHILPNVFHLAIITASLLTLNSIMSEVVLTYLGVGIQDGSSWGTMVSDATGELMNGIWWPLAGVTLALFALAYSLNMVGDALRDALDPKLVD
jgi:ABC-type dipeptide/oligopeptide/nickel transport system permease subunit